MPAIGHIGSYNADIEAFASYEARIKQFFIANDIEAERQAPALISTIGVSGYKTLQDLFAPDDPCTQTLDDLCTALRQHYSPRKLQLAERFRLHKCVQTETQTVTDFIAALRSASLHCGYTAAILDETLRDIFIVGLRNSHIQRELITKPDTLTFQEACTTAKQLEAASKEVSKLSSSRAATSNVNAVKSHRKPQRTAPAIPAQRSGNNERRKACYRCGEDDHMANACRFRDVNCRYCKKRGHIDTTCYKKRRDENKSTSGSSRARNYSRQKVHQIEDRTQDDFETSDYDEYIQIVQSEARTGEKQLHKHATHIVQSDARIGEKQVHKHARPDAPKPAKSDDGGKFMVTPKINNVAIDFEIDTGSNLSIIPESIFSKAFPTAKLRTSDKIMRTYTNDVIKTCGMMTCTVKIHGQRRRLPVYVTKGGNNPLFGRSWIRALKLNWAEVKAIHDASTINNDVTATRRTADAQINTILKQHAAVFEKGFGQLKNTNARFYLKDNAKPAFAKARNVPYALREKVDAELDRLEKAGIISPVKYSEWASPICCVPKSDGTVRICGDFKSTLNPQLRPEQHPMPKIEDIFATLSGGEKFTKLDLTQAYLSINIDPEHRKYVTINTQKGLYQYNRVPYGVTDSGAKFQKPLDQLLAGAPGTQAMVDDVIITGKDDVEHLQNLEEVIRRLHDGGLKANKAKCVFMQNSVTFCGHVISKDGIRQEPGKRRAIQEAPKPRDQKELLSFIGLIGFYRKFVPNISSLQKPLTELAYAKTWRWEDAHERALKQIKHEIASDRVLTHYDPSLPVKVAVDASPVGLGCVMSHTMPDGSERPVLFLSRALTDTERPYSHLHKEALGIFWAVRKLYHYLFGRHFTLVTDNKPLAAIFHPDKNIPEYSALRLQRYAIFLAGLNYTIETRPTKLHGNCDALSRLPLPHNMHDVVDDNHLFNVNQLESIPVNANDVAQNTKRDAVMSRVYMYVQNGHWDDDKGPFEPFYRKRHELSTQQGVLFWQNRVVIPPPLRKQLLEELHVGHPGVVRMKAVARSYIWYPNIDSDIENHVLSCVPCAQTQKNPPECQLQNWRYPDHPMDRVHIDFAGPIEGKQLLIIVDAHTKWPHVEILNSTATAGVIECIRSFCAMFGLIKTLVSDNATCFTSDAFKTFCRSNGMRHVTGAVYHSRSNGKAEIVVKQVKNALKAMTPNSDKSLRHRLDEFLFRYRITPHGTTGEKPCVLMLNRSLRTRLDLIRPSLRSDVMTQQAKSRKHKYLMRKFQQGDPVMMKDYSYRRDHPWSYAEVVKKTGPVSYNVQANGKVFRRHADQLARTRIEEESQPPALDFYGPQHLDQRPVAPQRPPPQPEKTPNQERPPSPRRSNRIRNPVARFGQPLAWDSLKK